jgi:hypothetical protein
MGFNSAFKGLSNETNILNFVVVVVVVCIV